MVLGGGTFDRSGLVRYWKSGEVIHVPYVGIAATDGTHKIVIDTGDRVENMNKPNFHQSPQEELPYLLKQCMGWETQEVDTVINTHLHSDHCGGNFMFPNAKLFVQREEWLAAWDLSPDDRLYYDTSYYDKHSISYFQWEFLDGEEELFPGLRVLPAPGHTYGSQIVLLDTEEGTLCFPGDTVPTQLNLDQFHPPAITADDQQIFHSMRLVRRVADRIIFSHDDSVKTGMSGGFPLVPDP